MPPPRVNINRLTLEFEQFTFDTDATRQRVKKVSGILSKYTDTDPAVPPFSHYTGGNTDNAFDSMDGYDRGHVIQAVCSDVSTSENIVPMYPCFNQAGGLWRELELRVSKYVDTSHVKVTDPRSVFMSVEIEYNSSIDTRFPTAFVVTVSDNQLPVYFKGVPLTGARFPHLPIPVATLDPVAEIGAAQVDLIRGAADEIKDNGWTIEKLYPNAAVVGGEVIPIRPYAMLDYLWLQQKHGWVCDFLTDGCKYRDGFAAEFHERQKMLIRIVNAMGNNGSLRSDYPGDTTERLIIGSGQRSAQIDHVLPYAGFGILPTRYGGNLFSNALVASGAFNNRMKNAPPSAKWADRGGAVLYNVTRHL